MHRISEGRAIGVRGWIHYPPGNNKNQATFDAFSATTNIWHSVHNAGFKSLGVDKVYFVGITPVGVSLVLPCDPDWDDDFVAMVYHLSIS